MKKSSTQDGEKSTQGVYVTAYQPFKKCIKGLVFSFMCNNCVVSLSTHEMQMACTDKKLTRY